MNDCRVLGVAGKVGELDPLDVLAAQDELNNLVVVPDGVLGVSTESMRICLSILFNVEYGRRSSEYFNWFD